MTVSFLDLRMGPISSLHIARAGAPHGSSLGVMLEAFLAASGVGTKLGMGRELEANTLVSGLSKGMGVSSGMGMDTRDPGSPARAWHRRLPC